MKKAITLPKLSIPKSGGSFEARTGGYEVGNQGEGSFAIPLAVPVARGIKPPLHLSYNSGSGMEVFGLGFALTTPHVVRNLERGIPTYTSDDTFILSDLGELLEVKRQTNNDILSISYLPRIETSFAKIKQIFTTKYDSYWEVIGHNGMVHIYGKGDNDKIFDPNAKSRVLQWNISSSWDAKGNGIIYHYKREDDKNVDKTKPSEKNRVIGANVYPASIEYGNWRAKEAKTDSYTYKIVFDYGEYDLSNPEAPAKDWKLRSDPFSHYKAGFERRCYRLCRNILIYHQFPAENKGQPFLNHVYSFTYKTEKLVGFNQLTAYEQIGYRKQKNTYQMQKLPTTTFGYVEHHFSDNDYKDIQIPNHLKMLEGSRNFEFIDLNGNGIPGIIYRDDTNFFYAQPLGKGEYEEFSSVDIPSFHHQMKTESFADLNHNGRLDFVYGNALYGGFFLRSDDDKFQPYQSFEKYSPAFANQAIANEHIDINGNGQSSLLQIHQNYIIVYEGLDEEGFGNPYQVDNDNNVPTLNYDAKHWIGFGDLFGDGRVHRIRIIDGCVESWASLGKGRFAKKVTFDNAPTFANFDSSRLHLVDSDGSGVADILYFNADNFLIYFNQSGNGFSSPITIKLKIPYTNRSRIWISDIKGSGSYGFVLSTPGFDSVWYDFSTDGKPHLLCHSDNGYGGEYTVSHCSSVDYFLADKAQGKPWKMNVPFPIQVVNKIEVIDNLTDSKSCINYAYHEGYYDSYERKFRGFAYTESWDNEQTHLLNNTLDQPTVYSKQWYFIGVVDTDNSFYQHLATEFYQQDSRAYHLPINNFVSKNDKTLQESYQALQGHLLRSEVYALDKTKQTKNPYQVIEHNYQLLLLHEADTTKDAWHGFASFFVSNNETLDYHYERDPFDPRVGHTVLLKLDKYGHPLLSCNIVYGRRNNNNTALETKLYPQQKQVKLSLGQHSYFNQDDQDLFLLSVPINTTSYEIHGIKTPDFSKTDHCFTRAYLLNVIKTALANIIAYEQPFADKKIQARMLNSVNQFYWDKQQQKALPYQQATLPLLKHHHESSIYTTGLIAQVYKDKVASSDLKSAGYLLKDKIYWMQSEVVYCQEKYCLISGVSNVFGKDIQFKYDDQALFVVKATHVLKDDFSSKVVKQSSVGKIDYQALKPWQLIDNNNITHEVAYDPLGRVYAETMYGKTNGKAEGNEAISHYQKQAQPTLADILKHPDKYVQSADTYIFYDDFSWQNNKQPMHDVFVKRDIFVHHQGVKSQTQYPLKITYFDGLGRALEVKMQTQYNNKITYICSGRSAYNNKGKKVKFYENYYTENPNYDASFPVDILPPGLMYYDPLGRLYQTQTPKGFITKTKWSGWHEGNYDRCDTVKDSPYFKGVMSGKIPATKDEKTALQNSSIFYKTPGYKILDSQGYVFLHLSVLLDAKDKDPQYLATTTTIDFQGRVIAQADPRLGALNPPVQNIQTIYNMGHGKTSVMVWNNVDSGIHISFFDIRGLLLKKWDSRGFCSSMAYDNNGRQFYKQVTGQEGELKMNHRVHQFHYGDFLPNASTNNLNGKTVVIEDSSGRTENLIYNITNNLCAQKKTFLVDYKQQPDWRKNPKLEDTHYQTNWQFNALNRVMLLQTADGTQQQYQYNLVLQPIGLTTTFNNKTQVTHIKSLDYNAQGQEEKIQYGNGIVVVHSFEKTTHRVIKIQSKDKAGKLVQDLLHVWDPEGNLSFLTDNTIKLLMPKAKDLDCKSVYTYDSLYRLKTSTGYQHVGIKKDTHVSGFKQSIYMPLPDSKKQ
ncbi:SpvB/TcaC N-terminal domain-containing protein [Bathymodiolus thermophilus thioautotrophic gill symbiont]|uniref:Uncharacterized protein n=1 Tax=Bathymodiolus thermophilus thioautotrophic gill symbiont TaxID=2360 RepID=A0A8H8XF85_9GAMM|nr:SpvB/TcaC N-terminal domain-containing protein [Bathymodiolus thermophilus thioautotrophic gill symbiont]CAB5500997.1 hypothetical protein THERMOS_1311 [Bathymodiolus thermophilus thioautotrophic gill symbiont]